MASIISAGTTSGTSLNLSGDTSGVLQLATNGSTTAVTVDTSQRVGIGTASPALPLDINTGGSGSVNINGTGSGPWMRWQLSGTAFAYIGSGAQLGAGSASDFCFNSQNNMTFTSGGNSERMRIDTSGNVGIGTSSSGNKFEVAGSGMFSGAVTTNTTGTHISYQSGNSQIGAWGPDTSTNGTLVFFSARSNGVNGLERMRIDSNGNLIMASNAGYLQLPTNQTMRVPSTGGIGYVGNINSATVFQIAYNSTSAGVQLSSGATSWGTFSDSRLKNITGTYTNALNDIAQIQPVKFTWKSDENSKPQVGVIAQSVENVVPEAVDSTTIEMDGTEKYLTVRYTELIPLMIASIQELKAELDATKAEVAALKGVN